MTTPGNFSQPTMQGGKHGRRIRIRRMVSIGVLLLLQSACGEAVYDQIELMPPPVVFKAGAVDPLPNISEVDYQRHTQLFGLAP